MKLGKRVGNIFKLYKGWSFESAIRDIFNININAFRHNIYPDWFRKQFKKHETSR